ncbi:MAG: ABC transporter permease [Betaproteobacteria bacterium]|jgi:ABC-type polysaccharide/polyol phosphate export systems, permease component|nr:ABC transporter permease [Betaproteobacteria bacterium]
MGQGFITLTRKEILRFWKVSLQTLLAPLISTLLYLVVFSQVMGQRPSPYGGVSYAIFLVPGLVMMAMLQNAFANSSSSLVQSKVTGNLVFVLLAPISEGEFLAAYVAAAMVRGMMVGFVVWLTAWVFIGGVVYSPLWVMVFGFLSIGLAGVLGVLAGISAEKFDQMAAWQNFLILPLTFLSGAFYSIHSLPTAWQIFSRFNPFFYAIDGFRYGFVGASDVPPMESLFVVAGSGLALSWTTLVLLRSGWRLRP